MTNDMRSKPQGIKGKMLYTIKVNQSEGRANIPRSTLDFIRALLTQGHEVNRVFFYHDGVREAFGSFVSEWVELAEKGPFELILCSQALEKRGFKLDVQPPFIVGGLGLWVDACLKADRILTFGASSVDLLSSLKDGASCEMSDEC